MSPSTPRSGLRPWHYSSSGRRGLGDPAGGLGGLIALAWLALVLEPATVPDGSQAFLAWVTAAILVLGAVGAALVLRGSPLARRIVPARIASTIAEARSVLRDYLRAP